MVRQRLPVRLEDGAIHLAETAAVVRDPRRNLHHEPAGRRRCAAGEERERAREWR
jgi:hypothetical protein